MRSRRWLFLTLGVTISVLFAALTLRRVDYTALADSLLAVNFTWLLVAASCKIGAFAALTIRAQLLFRPQHKFTPKRQLHSILLGYVGNNVLPFRAGEIMRVGYLGRHGKLPFDTVLATVALERLLDLFCLMLILLGTMPFMAINLDPGVGFYALTGLLATAFVGALAMSRWPAGFVRAAQLFTSPFPQRVSQFIVRRVEGFAGGLAALASPILVAGALTMSLLYWTSGIFAIQCWLWAFGLQLPWYAPLVVTVFLAFGTLLPSAPGFVGTYHYFAATALSLFAVPENTAVSVAIVGHAVAFLPWTLVGIPIVLGDLILGWRSTAGTNIAPEHQ